MSGPYLGEGRVGHARVDKVKNNFKYPTFFLFFRSDQDENVKALLKNKFRRFFRFEPTDYLKGEGGSLDQNVRNFIRDNFQYEPDEVWLQTMPRMFNYAFNPVSFWLCLKNDRLEAVLCEVNNTFGERHMYWVKREGYAPLENEWVTSQKVFHVSPFLPVEGSYKYKFSFRKESSKFRADIIYLDPQNKPQLTTYIEGALSSLEEQKVWPVLKKYGWMTVFVVVRIHLQALKLWMKRMPYFSKPSPPEKFVT